MNALRSRIVNLLAASPLISQGLRGKLYRLAGMSVLSTNIAAGQQFIGTNVVIGERVFVNLSCLFDTNDGVILESDVQVGPRCMFLTSSHQIGGPSRRGGPLISNRIVVGRGTWLGGGVTVIGGVTIGPGCVVAAGSVITKDVPANVLVAGVPGRVLRPL